MSKENIKLIQRAVGAFWICLKEADWQREGCPTLTAVRGFWLHRIRLSF